MITILIAAMCIIPLLVILLACSMLSSSITQREERASRARVASLFGEDVLVTGEGE